MNATELHPAILSVSRQTYLEASGVLYSENRFRFLAQQDKPFHVTADLAVILLLEDRSEATRRLIRVVVRLLPPGHRPKKAGVFRFVRQYHYLESYVRDPDSDRLQLHFR